MGHSVVCSNIFKDEINISAFVCCFSLCDDFEKIAEKALSTPPNTAELMEVKVLSIKSLSLYTYKLFFSFLLQLL